MFILKMGDDFIARDESNTSIARIPVQDLDKINSLEQFIFDIVEYNNTIKEEDFEERLRKSNEEAYQEGFYEARPKFETLNIKGN